MSKYEFLIFMLKKHDLVLSRSNELGSKGEDEDAFLKKRLFVFLHLLLSYELSRGIGRAQHTQLLSSCSFR